MTLLRLKSEAMDAFKALRRSRRTEKLLSVVTDNAREIPMGEMHVTCEEDGYQVQQSGSSLAPAPHHCVPSTRRNISEQQLMSTTGRRRKD